VWVGNAGNSFHRPVTGSITLVAGIGYRRQHQGFLLKKVSPSKRRGGEFADNATRFRLGL
jgi:hypothetical protein